MLIFGYSPSISIFWAWISKYSNANKLTLGACLVIGYLEDPTCMLTPSWCPRSLSTSMFGKNRNPSFCLSIQSPKEVKNVQPFQGWVPKVSWEGRHLKPWWLANRWIMKKYRDIYIGKYVTHAVRIQSKILKFKITRLEKYLAKHNPCEHKPVFKKVLEDRRGVQTNIVSSSQIQAPISQHLHIIYRLPNGWKYSYLC